MNINYLKTVWGKCKRRRDYYVSMQSPVAKVFWRLFKCLPVNNHLILFESEPDFCDNSWALYHYLSAHHLNYRYIWIVQDVKAFKGEKDNHTSFVTRYGKGMHLKTIFYYATAKYNFYTHWTFQPYIPRKGQTVVNLWHGTGVKDIKIKIKDYFDWVLTTGEAGVIPLSTAVGCSPQKTLPLGYPRNDVLLHNIDKGVTNPFCPRGDVSKVVLWMPTFRKSINLSISETACDTSTGLPLLETLEDVISFNKELKQLKTIVLIKIHHLQAWKDFFNNHFSNIIIITDEQLKKHKLQLYQIVGKSDALLTDYSSIMLDYLLTNKPMGFILDDLDKYEKSRGLLFDDVRKVMMGEHIFNKEQLMLFIKHVVTGQDDYKKKREEQKRRAHNASEGNACKNIVEYFKM